MFILIYYLLVLTMLGASVPWVAISNVIRMRRMYIHRYSFVFAYLWVYLCLYMYICIHEMYVCRPCVHICTVCILCGVRGARGSLGREGRRPARANEPMG